MMQKSIDTGNIPRSNQLDAYKTFIKQLPVKHPSKLLFINIPHVPVDLFLAETAKRGGYQNYPPTGYLYLAAAARLAFPEIGLSILDLNYEMLRMSREGKLDADNIHDFWKDLISNEIGTGEGLFVCVGNNWAVLTPRFLEITRFIKDSFSNVTLVTGGVETTQNYKRVIEGDYCHIAFRYNSELEFKSFLESCRKDQALKVPGGIAFKTGGQFYQTESGPDPTEFLDIRPYYHLIKLENYHKYGGMNPFSQYVDEDMVYGTVLSNRGCRASCTFCGVLAFYPNGVKSKPVASVIDEIRYLMDERGVRLIDWLDDDLTFGRKRSVELFKAMAEELSPGLKWISNNGITGCSINEELMYWMVKSGCVAFKVGVESGNEDRLRKIRKPATKQGLRAAGAIFSKYPRVHVSGNYILGFPEETFGEMLETFDFANELSWDWAGFLICQPVGGTPIFDTFLDLGDDRCEEDHFEGLIPARFAQQKADFGYEKGYHTDDEPTASVLSGRAIFDLPGDLVPSAKQLKEIWFTFNIITNFFNNRNWKQGGNLEKIVRWFESIHSSYPRDASMCAMLSHGHRLLGNQEKTVIFQEKFHRLLNEHDYWKRRVLEFPELLDFVG